MQYYTKKLFFLVKTRAPNLKKLHLESFPAIHLKRMDWLDFLLKFSSELLVILLSLIVAGLNIFFFSGSSAKAYEDKSLTSSFLSRHAHLNEKLFAKNNSIVVAVSHSGFVPRAQAEDFAGLDSQGLNNQDTGLESSNIILGNENTILAPNPDSVRGLISAQIKIYQTQSGDTLPKIAKNFGISEQTIMWANKLTSPAVKPGWQLIILPTDGVLVIADANDTLPDIAHQYNPEKYNSNATARENSANSLLEKIMSYNALEGAEDIQAGDKIIVPGGQIVAAPQPVAKPKPKDKKAPITYNENINQVTSLGSGYDGVSHIFPKGYCTWYVATKTKITFGGNAKNWLANAKASGYVTGKEPAPNSVVVMTANYPRSIRLYGHVAFVEKVESDRIYVSEMNYEGFNKKSYRWVPINHPSIRGYIYP